MIRRISQSEMTTFQQCKRKWYLQYVRRLQLPGADRRGALGTGTGLHAMVEAYYKGNDLPDLHDLMDDSKGIALVQTMYEGYHEWLAETGADYGLSFEGVEEKLEVPLGIVSGQEVTLTGRLDLRAINTDGIRLLMDNKTADSFDRTAFGLSQNFQLLTYAVLCRLARQEYVHGAMLNMFRKVGRTASAKPPFYERRFVHFNDRQLHCHWDHMQAIAGEILRTEESLQIMGVESDFHHRICAPNVTPDCSWKCDFQAVCPLLDDGSDAESAITQFYRVRPERTPG